MPLGAVPVVAAVDEEEEEGKVLVLVAAELESGSAPGVVEAEDEGDMNMLKSAPNSATISPGIYVRPAASGLTGVCTSCRSEGQGRAAVSA